MSLTLSRLFTVRANAFHSSLHSGLTCLVHFGNRTEMLENFGGPSSLVVAASANTEHSMKAKEALCYLAPEQTGNFDYITRTDHRTDLYSLGVLFWTLIVGRGEMPLEGSILEILHAIVHEAPLTVRAVRKDVPPMLSVIIDKVSLLSRYRRPSFTPCSYYLKTRISDIKGIPRNMPYLTFFSCARSAYGLKQDLYTCQHSLSQSFMNNPVPPEVSQVCDGYTLTMLT